MAGKPLSITLPVDSVHVGCVIDPTNGAVGYTGPVITTLTVGEVHPTELVTVKLYVAGARPDTVKLEPEPDIAPGLIVQFPEGNPFSTTLPVASAQVGIVIVPTVGAVGVVGCASTETDDGDETQVLSELLLTRILCEPEAIPLNVVVPCQEPPSILYWNEPIGAVTTIVPVATVQVG
jgi:hypothetical protein